MRLGSLSRVARYVRWTHRDTTFDRLAQQFSSGLTSPSLQLLTGPCGDHTSTSGKYAYIEASGCYGSEFEFFSPTIMYTNESTHKLQARPALLVVVMRVPCRLTCVCGWSAGATVSFYYFMYGADMDAAEGKATLTLSMKAFNASSPSWVDVVTFTGQQQTSPTEAWRVHEANVDSLLPATASTSAPMTVQYRFR